MPFAAVEEAFSDGSESPPLGAFEGMGCIDGAFSDGKESIDRAGPDGDFNSGSES